MMGIRDQGFRLGQPEGCPEQLHAVMMECWNTLPDDRPAFSDLLGSIGQVEAALNIV